MTCCFGADGPLSRAGRSSFCGYAKRIPRSFAVRDQSLGPTEFLSIREAAANLGVSYGSILAAIHNGRLVAYQFGPHGGTYRIRRCDLEDYIAASRTKNSPSRPKRKRTGSVFQKLDRERLLQAWRERGISADPCEEVQE